MRVARASSGPKIPRRKRGRIYEMEYLAVGSRIQAGYWTFGGWVFGGARPPRAHPVGASPTGSGKNRLIRGRQASSVRIE